MVLWNLYVTLLFTLGGGKESEKSASFKKVEIGAPFSTSRDVKRCEELKLR